MTNFNDLKKQVEALISNGYDKEQIMKMVEIAPAIFCYTTEGIKMILDSIDEPIFIDNDNITSFCNGCDWNKTYINLPNKTTSK